MRFGRAHDDAFPAPGALALLGLVALVLNVLVGHVLPRLSRRCPRIDAALLDVQRAMVGLAVVAWNDVEIDPTGPASVWTEVVGAAMLRALAALRAVLDASPLRRGRVVRRVLKGTAAGQGAGFPAPRPAAPTARPRDGPA